VSDSPPSGLTTDPRTLAAQCGPLVAAFIGGTKIAKRGLPDTPQANTWIILEPGWFVRDVKGGKAIEVSYEHTRMH
jgi:hypothetical protein